MKKWIWIIGALALNTANAQTGTGEVTGVKSGIQEVHLQARIDLMEPTSTLNPVIQSTGIYHEDGEGKIGRPSKIPAAENYVEDGAGKAQFKTEAETPVIFNSFNGYNDYQFTPPDNSIGVSTNGFVMSAMNCNYRIFNDSGKLLKFSSFYDLFKKQFPTIKGAIYDPRILFDAESERFIVVALYQHLADSSRILVMFSQTEDPTGDWNLYSIPGNIGNKGVWTDYPSIAVSKNELFITGNLFNNSNAYKEPVVIQINKEDGLSGNSLHYQTWTSITDASGSFAFSLVPAGGGMNENPGPGIYLVSTIMQAGNRINLYQITGDMDDEEAKLTRYSVQLPFTYYSPTISAQKGSTTEYLNSGDCRMKQAFILNNVIHFVFATQNSTNFNAIVYGRLDVNTKQLDYKIFGQDQVNYTYPGLASLAQSPDDKSVIIVFERAASTLYPELGIVYCDDDMTFSQSVVVQKGISMVNITSDRIERWGDYTGIARNINSTNIYVSGCYGQGGTWTTRIANVGLASIQAGVETVQDQDDNAMVYPNPMQDVFSVSFKLRKSGPLNISLYDMQGRQVEILYNSFEPSGEKKFTFNPAQLSKGMYLLKATSGGKELFSRKLVR
jgi:hypothetical protein